MSIMNMYHLCNLKQNKTKTRSQEHIGSSLVPSLEKGVQCPWPLVNSTNIQGSKLPISGALSTEK